MDESRQIRNVGLAQRLFLWAVLASVLSWVLPHTLLVAIPFLMFFVFKMTKALAMSRIALVFHIIAMFIPLVQLICLLNLNVKATRVLRKAEIRVGSMGAKLSDLPPAEPSCDASVDRAANKKLNRYIPAFQIAAAANAVIFYPGLVIGEFSPILLGMLFVILTIYGLGLVGGILLWNNLRLGATISIAYWSLIMPGLSLPQSLAYDLDNLVYCSLFFSNVADVPLASWFNFGMSVGSGSFTFYLLPAVDATTFGVDFVAIALLGYLAWHWRDLDPLGRKVSS